MQDLILDGCAMWSLWQPERRMFFNSFFIRRPEGNIVIDPLALSPEQEALIEQRGGVSWIVVTNRDHERKTSELMRRFGARVATGELEAGLLSVAIARQLRDGEELYEGATVLHLPGGKTPGEIALHFPRWRAAIMGDALWGDPAGSLRLPPDDKLLDAPQAVLGLRKLWARKLDVLLVGDGACIFEAADGAIGKCLQARRDVYVNRVNLDEIPAEQFSEAGGRYAGTTYEIGLPIGARKLGYRVLLLPPGKKFCPMHAHAVEEEVFIVLEGEVTLRTPRGDYLCRQGDVIAFPCGDAGAHQVYNTTDRPCRIFMLGMEDPNEVAYYPESNKLLLRGRNRLTLRAEPALDYYEGE